MLEEADEEVLHCRETGELLQVEGSRVRQAAVEDGEVFYLHEGVLLNQGRQQVGSEVLVRESLFNVSAVHPLLLELKHYAPHKFNLFCRGHLHEEGGARPRGKQHT